MSVIVKVPVFGDVMPSSLVVITMSRGPCCLNLQGIKFLPLRWWQPILLTRLSVCTASHLRTF